MFQTICLLSVEKKVATLIYTSVEQMEGNYTLLVLWLLNMHSPVLGWLLYCLEHWHDQTCLMVFINISCILYDW